MRSSRRKKGGGRPKQGGARLGQHFLTARWAAGKLVASAGITPEDTVLEIGPGKGALTEHLLKTGARVIAIEKDEALSENLHETFAEEIASKRLHIVTGDVRDFNPANSQRPIASYILAANIPYYITGEILRHFLSSSHQPRTMALLVQKEVAERVVARDGKESILSLSVKAYGTPKVAGKVARGNFSPPPSVDSAILVVERISRANFEDVSERAFFTLLHVGFASKRKLLAGNLAKQWGREVASAALEEAGIPPTARAEDVPLQKWLALARMLEKA